jgi:hypothetical protein
MMARSLQRQAVTMIWLTGWLTPLRVPPGTRSASATRPWSHRERSIPRSVATGLGAFSAGLVGYPEVHLALVP